MRTSEEIYHRIRWDPRFDPARFTIGVNVRGAAPGRVPLPAFVPGGDIPWHRVVFIEADGEVVWDRTAGVDRIDTVVAGRVRDPRLLRAPHFSAGMPSRWDPVDGWRPGTGPVQASAAAPRLRVLTWNTLWDRYDSERIDTARRRPLLVAALERADADVIALQEVETALLDLLLSTGWVRARYTVDGDPAGGDVESSGLLLLSRLPVREAGRHALGPHKAVAAVTVDTAVGPLVVANTHLTSDHADRGAARREVELARLTEVLGGLGGPLVLVGDFNDDGTGPAAIPGLRDAWTEVRGADDRTVTFDPRANPLAAVSTLSGQPARLDRVLLRGTELRADAVDLLGDAPAAADGLFVSDHYGVSVDVALGGLPDREAGPVDSRPGRAAVRRRAGDAAPDDVLAGQVVARLRELLPEAVAHVVGSRRLGCALPGGDLDLVLAVPGSGDPVTVEARVRAGLRAVTDLRQVIGARVPGIRFRVDGLAVDLVVVATGDVAPTEAVARRTELGAAAAVALSAVSDADALLAAVGPHRTAFVGLSREVKRWARARGLDSAPFGGLPGLAWTVLAARTVQEVDDRRPAGLLRHFFAGWAGWDWREPIALRPMDVANRTPPGTRPVTTGGPGQPDATTPAAVDRPAVRIMTPSAPVRSCSGQVSAGGRDLLTEELYTAWELAEAAGTDRDPFGGPLAPPPLHRRHAGWAVVTVRAVRAEAFELTVGRVRGRIRALTTALEWAGAPDAHAWPRPFETGPDLVRYAIGLGSAPPAPDRFAELAAGWAAGLPGTRVDRVGGGEAPTLR